MGLLIVLYGVFRLVTLFSKFKNEDDAEWFENNIVYPEGTIEKSPLNM